MALDIHTPIGLIAVLKPEAIRRFEELGVDLALEHDRSLGDACAMRDIDPGFFLHDLMDDDRDGGPGLDWAAVRPVFTTEVEWEPARFLRA